jgi:hypothetical protein
MAGPCVHDKPLGSVKGGEVIDQLSLLLASQDGLYFM